MEILERLAGDPRALVEIYLNYDCDRTALENIFQKYVSSHRYTFVIITVSNVLLCTVSSSNCRGIAVYQLL